MPTPFTVTITATSVADPTKTASSPVIVAGTVASATQAISAASGGTITLPDGSSVTIAPNALPADQFVTLTELSYLPNQPPNTAIVGVGPGLVLTFGTPIPAMAQPVLSTEGAARVPSFRRASSGATSGATPSAFQFLINTGSNNVIGLTKSVPIVDFADTSNNNSFMGALGNYDSTTSTVTGNVGTDQWTAILSGISGKITSIAVSAANFAVSKSKTVFHLFTAPNPLILNIASESWTSYTASTPCPTGNTLLVVHGMNDYVEQAFSAGANGTPQLIQPIINAGKAGKYTSVVGFDYDWLQAINNSGSQLATFLNTVANCPGISLDIEAHSEGVAVGLSALTQMNLTERGAIKHFISLGGPIMGTPAANDSRILSTYLMGASALFVGNGVVLAGLSDLFDSPFVSDLEVSTPGDLGTLDKIRSSLTTPSNNNSPQVFVVAGTSPPQTGFLSATALLLAQEGVLFSDGFIPVASALAFQPAVTGTELLKVYPFAPFPTNHLGLVSDSNIYTGVGVQVASTLPSPSLMLSSSSICFLSLICSDPPGTAFSMSGNGYSTSNNDEFELLASGAVQAPPGPSSSFAAPNGSIPENGWLEQTTCSTPPETVVLFAENLTTYQESNAVTQEVVAGTCITTNPTPIVSNLSPVSLAVGSSPQTLTIGGTGFMPLSTVTFNGIAHAVTYMGTSVLTISLTSIDLQMAGTYPVVVTNPAPVGVPSSSANFTVTALTGTVSISPSAVTMPAGGVQTFSAAVTGGGSVTWSIKEGTSGGTVTTSGIYTAPAQTGTCHVIATNAANSSQTATSVVDVVTGPSVATIYSFNHATGGANPWSAPVFGSDGYLYGTTEAGGNLSCAYISSLSGCGTIYRSDTSGNVTPLHSFAGTDGAYPAASLAMTGGGIFYGTTAYGGTNTSQCDASGTSTPAGCGTVFSYSATAGFTSLLSFGPFNSPLGVGPEASLVQNGGTLYGETQAGGNTSCTGTFGTGVGSGCGSVFSVNSSNVPSTLHTFSGSEGAYPTGGLLQSNGSFYGTTAGGGVLTCSSYATLGCGTVFQMSSSGAIKTLHSFTKQDGAFPEALLILGADGKMYGTTIFGGSTTCSGGAQWQGCGTVFKIDTAGNFTSLHSFSGPDGAYPATLMQASDGFFYGTTESGGDTACTGRYGPGCGTVFRMDSAGDVTVLYSFTGKSDGSWPESALIQGTDGNLYGTAVYGGVNDDGVIFRVSNLTALTSGAIVVNDLPNVQTTITPVLQDRPHVGPLGPPVSTRP